MFVFCMLSQVVLIQIINKRINRKWQNIICYEENKQSTMLQNKMRIQFRKILGMGPCSSDLMEERSHMQGVTHNVLRLGRSPLQEWMWLECNEGRREGNEKRFGQHLLVKL